MRLILTPFLAASYNHLNITVMNADVICTLYQPNCFSFQKGGEFTCFSSTGSTHITATSQETQLFTAGDNKAVFTAFAKYPLYYPFM